jgi:hypothetical protein
MKVHCQLPFGLDLTRYAVELADENDKVRGHQAVSVKDAASLVEVHLAQLLPLWEESHVSFQLRVRARADLANEGFSETGDWATDGKTLKFSAQVPLQLPTGMETVSLCFSRGLMPDQRDELRIRRAATCPGRGFPWQLHFQLPLGEELLVAWPETEPELLIKRDLPNMYRLKSAKIRITATALPVATFSVEETLALMKPQQREARCYWDSIAVCSTELYWVDAAYFEGPGESSPWKPLSFPGVAYIAIRISASSFALLLCYRGPPLDLSTWLLEVWNPTKGERHAAQWDLRFPSLLLPPRVAKTGVGFELGLRRRDVLRLLMMPSSTAAQSPAPCVSFPLAPHRFLRQLPVMRQGCCVGVLDLIVVVRPLSGSGAYVLELQQRDGNQRAQSPCTVRLRLTSGEELDTVWADLLLPVWVPVRVKKTGLSKEEILRLFHQRETWLRLFAG